MGPNPASRARVAVTFLVTLVIVVAEFAFLSALYHLDDELQTQLTAQARVDGALRSWQPGDDAAPVQDAVRMLAADVPGVRSLQEATRTWAGNPGGAALEGVRSANDRLATALEKERDRLDAKVASILAAAIGLVSLGWFVWFRRLVRRHRGLQRELTERQALDAGERRLLALVQNSADLVVVLDPDSTASFVSPSAASVLGRAPSEIIGRPFVDLLLACDISMFTRLLAGSREADQTVRLRMPHADGRQLLLEGTLNNLVADPSVSGWVLTVRDVTEQQALAKELSHQAFHDALTGLPNRQLFGDRLAHALRRRDGGTEPLVVMLLDLDDFKNVNDSLGHGVGDQLLVAVAERITAALREGDTAARLGGDEFAVLMEDADAESAGEVAQRLLDALGHPVHVEGTVQSVRASIGMAQAVPGAMSSAKMLRNADVAMYWAKDRGKGTLAVYEAGLHAQALDRMALRGELQRAIREDQLTLHFQPTVDLATQRISGFEALVRWDHPTRGLLPPSEFIAVAEQSGLIVPLGSWVLREACQAGAGMQDLRSQPSMAVNIAAKQLAKSDFVEEVLEVLRSTGLPAERLVLEITESVVLEDMEGSIASLGRLRDHGVRVAIDDFGTGYSSLSYLSRLPVDILKIDKSFIDQVSSTNPDTSLVEAIIAMSEGMRLTTVAEGVEEPEQADWLALKRCTLGQGYLWSRPVDLAAARRLLTRGTRHLTEVRRVDGEDRRAAS